MAYPYYNSYAQYYPQAAQQNSPMAQQQNNSIIWVQGEAGAKSYLVAPNTTVTLWDTEAQTIYVKSADASGMPTMKILDYQMRNSAPHNEQIFAESGYATKDDISSIRAEIEALKAKFGDTEGGKKK